MQSPSVASLLSDLALVPAKNNDQFVSNHIFSHRFAAKLPTHAHCSLHRLATHSPCTRSNGADVCPLLPLGTIPQLRNSTPRRQIFIGRNCYDFRLNIDQSILVYEWNCGFIGFRYGISKTFAFAREKMGTEEMEH